MQRDQISSISTSFKIKMHIMHSESDLKKDYQKTEK